MIDHLLRKIITDQAVSTVLISLILAVCGYIVALFNRLKAHQETKRVEEEEQLKSIKRGSLRNEYLQIYNSDKFTQEQKWGLTRDIMRDYVALNGNHYIHTLDEELKESVAK